MLKRTVVARILSFIRSDATAVRSVSSKMDRISESSTSAAALPVNTGYNWRVSCICISGHACPLGLLSSELSHFPVPAYSLPTRSYSASTGCARWEKKTHETKLNAIWERGISKMLYFSHNFNPQCCDATEKVVEVEKRFPFSADTEAKLIEAGAFFLSEKSFTDTYLGWFFIFI